MLLLMNHNEAGLEKLSRNSSSETFNRMNGEYSFPCKHSGMEPHQNLRGSLDLYSNETIPAMHLLSLMDAGMQSRTAFDVGVSSQMLKRPSYLGDCNTKLEAKQYDMQQDRPTLFKTSKGPMNFGESFLDFRALPTLVVRDTFRNTWSLT